MQITGRHQLGLRQRHAQDIELGLLSTTRGGGVSYRRVWGPGHACAGI